MSSSRIVECLSSMTSPDNFTCNVPLTLAEAEARVQPREKHIADEHDQRDE